METKRLKVSEIKNNPDNPRIIKDDKFKKLVKSIKEFPEMMEAREIVVNQDHIILGGNMRFKAAKEAGLTDVPVKIVDWSEEKQREFVIKDNVSGGEWDWEAVANEYDFAELDDWGLDLPKDFEQFEDEEGEDGEDYSTKIDSPVYEPSDEKPEVTDLVEPEKVTELLANIENADIPEDIKLFLRVAAARHYKFNYSKIADYYAHSSGQVQALMEESALVIIDFDKAIEHGYVQMSEKIKNVYREEHEK